MSENPLRRGMEARRTPDPALIVIFGVTGDLAARKLIPALFRLDREGRLPHNVAIVGFGRREWSDEEFRAQVNETAATHAGADDDPEAWRAFLEHFYFQSGTFDDPDAYAALRERIETLDDRYHIGGNILHYLATPPDWFPGIAARLEEAGLVEREEGWQRLIIEKPFGTDLESARELNASLNAILDERDIYRIDHYLGKETVQNILVFRFVNAIWEPLWNRYHVDHVEITVAESLGIADRGGYYDRAGALRDIVQNHMMQLFMLVAMEPPTSFDAEHVRDQKVRVLEQIRTIDPERDAAPAQYRAGSVGGREVAGYREAKGVPDDSARETYIALRLEVENWRWLGVPFYLRTGKRLPRKITEIAVSFKQAPRVTFPQELTRHLRPNTLVMRIQPDEGISLTVGAKVPGTSEQIRNVTMDFEYGASFGTSPPDAYERLLLDALIGDQTLFTRRDEVERAWALFDPLLSRLDAADEIEFYEAGSWGPEGANALLARDGREWRRL